MNTGQAVAATAALVADGLAVTLDHLGESVTEEAHAEAAVQAYLELLESLAAEDLTDQAEVSVKLSA